VTGTLAAPQIETPVLIVGGGPVGLALALDLAYRGVRSTLAERDQGTATVLLAKANGLHERTMEMCRRWGIAERVTAVGFPADHPGDSVYATALYGHLIGRHAIPATRDRPTPDSTPEKRQRCPQYEFDPLLARAVQERGHTDVRYGHAFDRLEQDADEVTAVLRDSDGQPVRVRAQYVVGCDGAGSDVRRQLGVPFEGTLLDYSVSAMIRIPQMTLPAANSGGERYILISPDGAWCVFTSVDGATMWRITLVGGRERVDPADIDVPGAIRQAIGRDDVPFEVLRVVPWRRSQCSAASYRQGRVLLAGDAAHTTSPTGGHGLNTGIGDVSDLGWMLAALVDGWGGEGLLSAYDLERRPVAIRNARSSTANYQGWVDNRGYRDVLREDSAGEQCRQRIGDRLASSLHQEWNSLGIDLGYRYDQSPVVVPDGSPATPDDPSDYVPTSRPGHRAPHAWLADGRSTLDLFGPGFTLLRLGAPDLDVSSLLGTARDRGVPLRLADIDEPAVVKLYQRRLVLVRPDGHVAWRADAPPADAAALLDTVRGAR
jgi:2-polyprenyl-6-methoxyphenol hydroxylase-like FAD-dependent oxidoreductase